LREEVPAAKPCRLRRALPLVALACLTVGASLLLAPAALANFITPKSGGSPNADSISTLYKLILYVAIFVFVVVEGALLYSVYKFRARKGAVAAQIHGNTRLEIGWTLAAALILVVLTVLTFVKLPGIINPPNTSKNGLALSASLGAPTPPNNKPLVVCVQARQFIFRYTYGSSCKTDPFSAKLPYSFTDMVVPSNTTVQLAITASDVIHSWWIPSLGGKVDAVPGYTTYTWFKAPHPGSIFRGQCAQLCGREHYAMLARVRVVTPAQYLEWLTAQKNAINAANAQVTQLRQTLTASGNL
jgi:cytochrome c oxidase subunit II